MEKKRKSWINWALFGVTVVIVFLLGLLASSVTERKEDKFVTKSIKIKIADGFFYSSIL